MKRNHILTVLLVAVIAIPAYGQGAPVNSTVARDVLQQFQSSQTQWTTNIWPYAQRLFGLLALIEFAWAAAKWALEKSEMQSWFAALIREVMFIGFFYALLINGSIWLPAIIHSFERIGMGSAGISQPMAPSDIFVQGLHIAAALMDRGSVLDFFKNPGSSLSLVFAALMIVVSYTIITVSFIMTMAESYLLLSVGFIFLGFGGSRWTVPYTERLIGLAVSVGVKILLIYCIIACGMNLGVGWATDAQNIGSSSSPSSVCFNIMGGALIFALLSWHLPKLFGSVLGGSPSLGAGDGIGAVATMTGVAMAASGMVAAGASRIIGGSAAGATGAGAGASSASSLVTAGHSAYVPPPSASNGATGAGNAAASAVSNASQPAPPSSGNGYGSAGQKLQQTGNRLKSFSMGDHAGHVSPPVMPTPNHNED